MLVPIHGNALRRLPGRLILEGDDHLQDATVVAGPAPGIWAQIFGTGSDASLPNTYEWTYEPFTSSLAHPPTGWCLSGTSTCAKFFGGQTSGSKYALMWQWSGGGGSYNGYGDFDQIDANRTP